MKASFSSVATCFLLGGAALFGQYSTATRPDCGKYATIQFNDGTYSCERYAAFPWYAAGQSWQSQISMFVPPLDRVNGVARGASFDLGPGPGGTNDYLYGGSFGSYGRLDGIVSAGMLSSSSARIDLLDSVACQSANACFFDGNLALGPLWVSIDAPDVQTLEAANTQLIYLHRDGNGLLDYQVAVPPIFQDKAAANWVSSFSETPADQAAGVNDYRMSFAVINFSKQAQSVNVQLYNQAGTLITEKGTPTLAAGLGGDVYFQSTQYASEVIPGGVYAANLRDFFGLTAAQYASVLGKTGTFDGSIVFRASAGQPIAPLVVRQVGSSVTLLLQTPLP